jgi:NAD+ diphosphatase
MIGLPDIFASPLHLPFNRACLEGQLQMQGPSDDPGTGGYAIKISGHRLLVREGDSLTLPSGEWPESGLYLGLWQGEPCHIVDLPEGMAASEDVVALSL